MRILIADDELVSRSKLQKIMSSLGDCQAVDSGQAALDAFKEAWANWVPFDLITLDVMMPGMDGMETLWEIRSLEEEKKVAEKNRAKILMVTSQSERSVVITCVQAGCNDYLIKPFNLKMIKQKIEELNLKIPSKKGGGALGGIPV